ncbi:hypothetical protein M405DRAFT_826366 [Rhizopogon salebrosus TDB-379]|nr:hypothetical protein M405DRAFT_826366 [Rhizopogon salebrosus TDB-379]
MSAASTGLQTVHYFTVGAMAVAIYDYCLTTAPEVQLIWGRRWNVIRVTFTLARYVPFIVVVMNTYGKFTGPRNCDTYESVSNGK